MGLFDFSLFRETPERPSKLEERQCEIIEEQSAARMLSQAYSLHELEESLYNGLADAYSRHAADMKDAAFVEENAPSRDCGGTITYREETEDALLEITEWRSAEFLDALRQSGAPYFESMQQDTLAAIHGQAAGERIVFSQQISRIHDYLSRVDLSDSSVSGILDSIEEKLTKII